MATSAFLTGCGEDTTPAEAAPVLAERLDRVDAAVAADDPSRARKAIQALMNAAARARADGEITGDQADAILQAAGELLRQLPEADEEPEPAPPSDTPTETPSETPPDTGEEDEGDDKDKEDKKDKEEKDDDNEGKGNGNGSNGGNGPDDGHGN